MNHGNIYACIPGMDYARDDSRPTLVLPSNPAEWATELRKEVADDVMVMFIDLAGDGAMAFVGFDSSQHTGEIYGRAEEGKAFGFYVRPATLRAMKRALDAALILLEPDAG